jgi:hypothetical protein
MNQVDKEKMNQIISEEIEEYFATYLKCETYIDIDDSINISINFLDTEKHTYSENQMESYKDTIITYLEKSEFNESDFDIDYDFAGNIRLSHTA